MPTLDLHFLSISGRHEVDNVKETTKSNPMSSQATGDAEMEEPSECLVPKESQIGLSSLLEQLQPCPRGQM